MIIDGDGHFFETEEMFDKYMEPSLRNYRPRLLTDDLGYNFWVVDGETPYKRPSIKGAGAPGTAAPPGKAIQSARRASVGSQTLSNIQGAPRRFGQRGHRRAVPLSQFSFACQRMAGWHPGDGGLPRIQHLAGGDLQESAGSSQRRRRRFTAGSPGRGQRIDAYQGAWHVGRDDQWNRRCEAAGSSRQ